MIPEIDVSSVIAVITLFVFMLISYRYRKELFAEHNVDSFMTMFTLMFSLLTGLCLYVLLLESELFQRSRLVTTIIALGIGIGAGLFIDAWNFGKDDGPSINFLLGEKIADGKFWIIGVLMGILAVPFIGIFTFQSKWEYGLCWFLVIILPPILWVSLKAIIDQAVDRTRV